MTVIVDMSLHGGIHVLSWGHIDWFRAKGALGNDSIVLGRVILWAVVLRWLPVLGAEAVSAVGALKGQKIDCTASRMAA
jgi:hypothetical protein